MPVREIILFPNPILREKAGLADPCSERITSVIADLWDTLNAHDGVGIAAPQIGESLRILAVDASRAKRPTPNHGPLTLINPVIVTAEGHAAFREGCLSIPDLVAKVFRADNVTVKTDLPDGTSRTMTVTGFEAVVLQHEIDHLNGVLFIDRVRSARDIKIRSS